MSASPYSRMTGARQTMLSWARPIEAYDDLPALYRASFQALAGGAADFPYTLLAPPQEGAPEAHRTAESVLCDLDDKLYVLEQIGSQIVTNGFSYSDICSLEVGNVLLYSWFSIQGRSLSGTAGALTVPFNEATLRHFTPFFQKMRPAFTPPAPAALLAEQAKFDPLAGQNFKLMSFARQSLLPGERVLQTIYQPGSRLSLLGWLGKRFAPAIPLSHLTILTDREVILIGDAEGIAERKRSKYGGVRRYLARRSFVSADLERRFDDLLILRLHFSPQVRVERRFDLERLADVENLKKALEA